MILRFVLFFAFLAGSVAAQIRSPLLWKLEAQGCAESWILGSIHIPTPAVTNLPASVQTAFRTSDVVICELPFDSKTMLTISRASMGEKETLHELLPADLYQRCESLLQHSVPGFQLSALDHMELWAFSFSVLLIDYQIRYADIPPMDMAFYQRAVREGKEVGGLETAEEQLSAMTVFSKKEILDMLRVSLDDLDELRKKGENSMDRLIDAYCSGDVRRIDAEVNRTEKDLPQTIRDRFDKILLNDRNIRMAERIRGRMAASPKKRFFFVIGALHGMGEGSVIDRLEKGGVRISRIQQ